MKGTTRVRALAITAAILVTACASTKPGIRIQEKMVESLFSGVSVSVGALEPIPWQTISEDLRPKFNLSSANGLLSQVLPTVGSDSIDQSQRFVAEFALAWQGLQRSQSQNSTTSSTVDQSGNTSSESQFSSINTTSRSTPDPIQQTSPALPTLVRDGLGISAGDYSYDPSLKYRAATSLFQTIKLLDRYLDSWLGPSGSSAHLIRLQVTVSPFAQMQPYDIYTTITLDRDGPPSTNSSLRVFPIIIAENLEAISTSSEAENIRQIAAALTGSGGALSAGIGISNALTDLVALAGQNVNPLVTYAQNAPNSLTLRFGAPFHPRSRVAMRARTYDVVFVVAYELTNNQTESSEQLSIFHWSEMRHSSSGTRIPSVSNRDIISLRERLEESFRQRGIENPMQRIGELAKLGLHESCNPGESESLTGYVNSLVFDQKRGHCAERIIGSTGDYLLRDEIIRARDTASFKLINIIVHNPPRLPPEQITIYTDDSNDAVFTFGGRFAYDFNNPRAWVFLEAIGSAAPPTTFRTSEVSRTLKDYSSTGVKNRFLSLIAENGGQNELFEGPFNATGARSTAGSMQLVFPSFQAMGFDRTQWRPIVYLEDPPLSAKHRTNGAIFSSRFKLTRPGQDLPTQSFRVSLLGSGLTSVNGEQRMAVNLTVEAVSGTRAPSTLSAHRISLNGAAPLRFEKLSESGSIITSGITQRASISAADVLDLPGRYRILLDTTEPKHGELLVSIVGLTGTGELIDMERASIKVPAKH